MKKLLEKIAKFQKKHPLPKKAKKPFLILTLLTWAAITSIASQYLIGYAMLFCFGKDFLLSTVGNVVYQVVSYALTLALTIFVPLAFTKKARTTREELGLSGLPTWTDIGLSPLAFVVSTLLAMALGALFSLFPWFNASEAQDLGYTIAAAGGDRILMFFAIVIIAPIVEEIVFRGWLYGKLRAHFAMPISILLTSLIFGIVHLQWNVGVNVFAVSVVLCVLRELTGTIYAGILTHIIKNGVAFYLVYIMGFSL